MDERQPLLDASNTQHNDDQDPVKQNIVEFNPDGDDDNPRDWTKRYRWCIVLLLCADKVILHRSPKLLIESQVLWHSMCTDSSTEL